MSWLELDDQILEHPKFIRAVRLAGSEAIHMWLGLRAYCGQKLTDGAIPADMMDEVRGPTNPKKRAAAIDALVTVGLVDRTDDNGLQLHDYLHWSKSKDEVLKLRASAAARKRRQRGGGKEDGSDDAGDDEEEPPAGGSDDGHGGSHGVTDGGTHGGTHGDVTAGVPGVVTNPRARAPLRSSPIRSAPSQIDLGSKVIPGSEAVGAEPPKAAASAPPAPPGTAIAGFEFPCTGGPGPWFLTTTQLEEWEWTYPNLDVQASLRSALSWARANPRKRKTFDGWPRRLVSWMNDDVNRGKHLRGGNGAAARAGPAERKVGYQRAEDNKHTTTGFEKDF